jgi:hypothetical protein
MDRHDDAVDVIVAAHESATVVEMMGGHHPHVDEDHHTWPAPEGGIRPDALGDPPPDKTLPPAAELYATAVEYVGRVRDRRDWQTPLAPFAAVVGDTAGVTGVRRERISE